jgi:hypothetical protein
MVLMPQLMIYGKPPASRSLVDYDLIFVDPEIPARVRDEFRLFCRSFSWRQGTDEPWRPVLAAKQLGSQGGILFVRVLDRGRDGGNRPHTMECQGAFLCAAKERAADPGDLNRLANPEGWDLAGNPPRLNWLGGESEDDAGVLGRIRASGDWTLFGNPSSHVYRSPLAPPVEQDGIGPTIPGTNGSWGWIWKPAIATVTLASLAFNLNMTFELDDARMRAIKQNNMISVMEKQINGVKGDPERPGIESLKSALAALEKQTEKQGEILKQKETELSDYRNGANAALVKENTELKDEIKKIREAISSLAAIISKIQEPGGPRGPSPEGPKQKGALDKAKEIGLGIGIIGSGKNNNPKGVGDKP